MTEVCSGSLENETGLMVNMPCGNNRGRKGVGYR